MGSPDLRVSMYSSTLLLIFNWLVVSSSYCSLLCYTAAWFIVFCQIFDLFIVMIAALIDLNMLSRVEWK